MLHSYRPRPAPCSLQQEGSSEALDRCNLYSIFSDRQEGIFWMNLIFQFLVADTRLYTLLCRSVRPSVRPSEIFPKLWADGLPCIRPCLRLHPSIWCFRILSPWDQCCRVRYLGILTDNFHDMLSLGLCLTWSMLVESVSFHFSRWSLIFWRYHLYLHAKLPSCASHYIKFSL